MPKFRVYSGQISTIASPRDPEHKNAPGRLLGPCNTPGDRGAAPRPWAQKSPQALRPGGLPYLPLHQPSAVLWLYHVLPSLPWFSFIATPCLGQCGVSSVGLTTRGNRWSTASRRCSKRPSSLSRNVSCTWRPLSSRCTLIDAGASGNGEVGTAGEACGSAGGSAWPLACQQFPERDKTQ